MIIMARLSDQDKPQMHSAWCFFHRKGLDYPGISKTIAGNAESPRLNDILPAAGRSFSFNPCLEFIKVNIDDGSNIEGDELREKQPPDYCQAQWTASSTTGSNTIISKRFPTSASG